MKEEYKRTACKVLGNAMLHLAQPYKTFSFSTISRYDYGDYCACRIMDGLRQVITFA